MHLNTVFRSAVSSTDDRLIPNENDKPLLVMLFNFFMSTILINGDTDE
jgi:hypothetical protein